MPSPENLASAIKDAVVKIESISAENDLPVPSFDEDAVYHVSEKVSQEVDIVLDATAELHDLFSGPRDLVHRHCGLAAKVQGLTSFKEMAENTPLTESMATRLIRHAITMRIFCEPQVGFVAHTAASKLLANPAMNDYLLSVTRERWPAATKAYSLAKNTNETLYEIYNKDTKQAAWLARGMTAFSKLPQFNISHTLDHYPWMSLEDGLVVDVGGSHGHVGFQLAQRFPQLRVIVQDLESVVASASVPPELSERVSFMPHDFFTPQPVAGADVYFLRLILHNWSDTYCLRILSSLLPALKDGCKVIVEDNLMPDYGSKPLWKERKARTADITAAILFNAAERTAAEFELLFSKTDPGFALQQVIKPPGSQLSLLEFTWRKSEN
ncbi:O-methyltransferase [Sphaerulina musiva SO2202]|uniref:O-methyltransferase n=1 Tax=Sphaerulina musiva (strain SO2202) TaxID=692275 RepID=N1QM51_SPHMS|nr:O-methyltransferase [Sphaerulina musiva SO2202]EMF16953.1 O-methyltransferase [Sphaerulina musiva SO2202]